MTLSEAISAVESTQTALVNADGILDGATTKLAAAQKAQSDASVADTNAATAANDALDALIATATAAKRTVPAPTPTPGA